MFLLGVISYGGEETHKQNPPPQIPGQSREKSVYVFFFSLVFFTPKSPGKAPRGTGAGRDFLALKGRENSGNALEASNAFNFWAWAQALEVPSRTSRGELQEKL